MSERALKAPETGGESSVERRERIVVENRAEAVQMIRKRFIDRLRERFGEGSDNPLSFHNIGHTSGVVEDSIAILKEIQKADPSLVSDEDLELMELEALAHDLVQNATLTEGTPRRRHRGMYQQDLDTLGLSAEGVTKGNEQASADELIEELKRYQYADGTMVWPTAEASFTDAVKKDIAVTYPDFKPNQELPDGTMGLKVFQPYLTADVSVRGFALATADLRGDLRFSGNLEIFREAGDAEFREVNAHYTKEIEAGIEHISPERRREIAKAILDWKKSQPGFAKWQKVLFYESLEKVNIVKDNEVVKKALIERYGYHNGKDRFDMNIEHAQKHADELEAQFKNVADLNDDKFKKLLCEIGYGYVFGENQGIVGGR